MEVNNIHGKHVCRYAGNLEDLKTHRVGRTLPISYPSDTVDVSGKTDTLAHKLFTTPARMKRECVTRARVAFDFLKEMAGIVRDIAQYAVTAVTLPALYLLFHKPEKQEGTLPQPKSDLKKAEMQAITGSVSNALQGVKKDFAEPPKTPSHRLEMEAESQSVSSALPKSIAKLPYQQIDAQFMQDMIDAGPQGKTVLAGPRHVEDQAILAWTEKNSAGETILNLSCRLTRLGDRRLKRNLDEFPGKIEESGELPLPAKTLQNGILTVEDATVSIPMGKRITIPLGDNVTAVYSPRISGYRKNPDPNVTPYATQGKLTIQVKNPKLTPDELTTVLKQAEKLGVRLNPSTPEDLEYQYLKNLVYAYKANTPEYREGLAKNLTSSTKAKFMKRYLSSFLGVDDVTKAKGYDWRPKFDTLCNPGGVIDPERTAGYPHWERFDADSYITGELKDHHLLHNVYSKPGMLGKTVANIIRSAAGLVCTEDRFTRLGIMTTGISSLKDRRSGGAEYVFTHLEPGNDNGTFVLSKDLLKRTDQLAYHPGVFGHTMNKSTEKRVTLDTYHRAPLYEVMFKHTIPFMDYLEKINLPTEKERQEVLQAFKDVGISEIRDKKIEDVVTVRGNSMKA